LIKIILATVSGSNKRRPMGKNKLMDHAMRDMSNSMTRAFEKETEK
jgi:hypothetical protein